MTYDSHCLTNGKALNYNKELEKDDNVLSLTPMGVQPSIISVDFSPDWYNHLIIIEFIVLIVYY